MNRRNFFQQSSQIILIASSITAVVGHSLTALAQNNRLLLSQATTEWIKGKWKNMPHLQGQYSFRFFGLAIYQAQLWVDGSINPSQYQQSPLALQLLYERSLYGKEIAKRSLEEIKRQGDVSNEQAQQWLDQMNMIFPNVKANDHITGIYQPGQNAVFFLNQKFLGQFNDKELSKRFFGIWLSPQTSEPKMRMHLLGLHS